MASLSIHQDGHQIIVTTKTIEWLIHNTSVSVFDPVRFEGYQRQIDENHCLRIVSYLKGASFLPSSIICACEEYSDEMPLRIVDGQHRVRAFMILAEKEPVRYAEINKIEIPVVVLVGVPIETEIQTFITINKTSKKVDTSLAFVLKNKLSKGNSDMVMSRAEYVAVEVAQRLNEREEEKLWANRILYEGNVKKSNCYISLNAFVKANRVFINTLNQIGYINLNWNQETKQEEVQHIVEEATDLILFIWKIVYQRWPELVESTFEEKQILQGSIGYTAITRMLVKLIKGKSIKAIELKEFIFRTILSIKVSYVQWTKDGTFSSYSSESGFKIVSETLINSIDGSLSL